LSFGTLEWRFEVGVVEKCDMWVTADPRLGHANGELVILAKPMESDPPARPKERDSEAKRLCVGSMKKKGL
jgi:hypothetical protein